MVHSLPQWIERQFDHPVISIEQFYMSASDTFDHAHSQRWCFPSLLLHLYLHHSALLYE